MLQAQNVYVWYAAEVFIDALHHPSHHISLIPSQEAYIHNT